MNHYCGRQLECLYKKNRFAFELVWRYETGFIVFQKYCRTIFLSCGKSIKDNGDWSLQDKNKKWFYIGQSLLREYREDMNWNSWQSIRCDEKVLQ